MRFLWSLIGGNLSEVITALSRLLGALGIFAAGTERAKRKATERDVRRANEIEDRADEAKKRIADDKRSADERLRDLGRLRDD